MWLLHNKTNFIFVTLNQKDLSAYETVINYHIGHLPRFRRID